MGRRQDNRAGKTNRDDLKRFHPVEKQQTCRETQRPLSAVFSTKEFQCHNSENEAIWAGLGQAEKRRSAKMGEHDKAEHQRMGKYT